MFAECKRDGKVKKRGQPFERRISGKLDRRCDSKSSIHDLIDGEFPAVFQQSTHRAVDGIGAGRCGLLVTCEPTENDAITTQIRAK